MDKENIRSYLTHARQLLKEDRIIEAYETLKLVLDNINEDLRRENRII
jgi:hypothetical protein